MENEIFRRARGISIVESGDHTVAVNGRLEPYIVDATAVEILHLIDGTRTVRTIIDLAEKSGIQREKTREVLKTFSRSGIIVRTKEDTFYPEDERIFTQMWKGFSIDPLSVDVLLRIHAMQDDPYLRRIIFLPSEKKENISFLLKKILKYACRTPIINFLEADKYLDSFEVLELIKTARNELEYDMPYFFFEFSKNIFHEKDIEQIVELVKIPPTQILGTWTKVARVFGEDTLHLGTGIKLDSYDDNVCIGFDIDVMTSEELDVFWEFPGISLIFIAKDVNRIEELSGIPYTVLLDHSELEETALHTVLQSSNVFFMEDDVYRVQQAMQNHYIPSTDCGAGKRKIAVTLEGEVYPCDVAYDKEYCMGSLREESMEKILKGEKAQKIRDKIQENFKKCADECCLAFFCAGCLISERCNRKKEMLSFHLESKLPNLIP